MSNPTPKELSDRLEALRRMLRVSGKIGTESAENYELVSILDGIAGLEGLRKKFEAIDEEKMVEDFYLAEGKRFGTPNGDERAIQTELVKFAIGYISGFINPNPATEPR